MNSENYITSNETETIQLGKRFAQRLMVGDTVALEGDLGAGKTEFIKGVCEYFNVGEIVTSPTFTIINQYNGQKEDKDISIYHIDLYRIKTKQEFDEIGFADCIYSSDSIKLIEWAEKANGMLPENLYVVEIRPDDNTENKRSITITSLN